MSRPPNWLCASATAREAGLGRDVGSDRGRASPERGGDAVARRFVTVGDDHASALGDELLHDAFAEPGAAARDDRDLALQSHPNIPLDDQRPRGRCAQF